MEKDRFDVKAVNIGQKTFELGIMMSGFVLEILGTFDNMRADLNAQIPYYDYEKGYLGVNVISVYIDMETELINLQCENMENHLLWDDLDFSAKEIILNELHHIYKAGILYKNLSSGDGDLH